MFPIFSPTGQCQGFGGRILTKDNQAKYVNSAESSIFHKGRVFYGLDHAVKHIRTEDEVIVVEGYMDWLALAKGSIVNAVATLGTALTPDHAQDDQALHQPRAPAFRRGRRRALGRASAACRSCWPRGYTLADYFCPTTRIPTTSSRLRARSSCAN